MRLLFLHGPVAAGKLTVAKELAALTGYALFHNHLVVDALAAVFPFASKPFVTLRERFWLDVLREAAAAGRSTIFTFAPEPSVAPDFPERARQTVAANGGETVFVRLTLSQDEQERRIANADRARFGKLTSLALLRDLRRDFAAAEAAMPESRLTIDSGRTPPAAAARAIADGLGLPPRS